MASLPNVYLSYANVHSRDAFISFDEGPHVYTVHGQTGYTSVTTFIHSHFSHFDADSVIDGILKGRNYNTDPHYKYYGMTKQQIKDMWNQNGREASGAGTKMHYEIECFMNQELIEEDTSEPIHALHEQLHDVWMDEFIATGKTIDSLAIEWRYFLQFVLDFPHFCPYRTEWFIFDENLKLAGSVDMVYKNDDGTLSIYDWKRSKEIKYEDSFKNQMALTPCVAHLPDTNFWHYSLQLNLYKAILERNYNVIIRDLYLIILHPDNPGKTYERIECANLQTEINQLLQDRLSFITSST